MRDLQRLQLQLLREAQSEMQPWLQERLREWPALQLAAQQLMRVLQRLQL